MRYCPLVSVQVCRVYLALLAPHAYSVTVGREGTVLPRARRHEVTQTQSRAVRALGHAIVLAEGRAERLGLGAPYGSALAKDLNGQAKQERTSSFLPKSLLGKSWDELNTLNQSSERL